MGNRIYDFWIVQGYGNLVIPALTDCNNGFKDWDGTTPVLARNFCDVQPEHPDCKKGRVEDYSSASTVAESTPAIPSQTQFHRRLGIRWIAATALEIERVADNAERVLLDGASARYMEARYMDMVISTNEGAR